MRQETIVSAISSQLEGVLFGLIIIAILIFIKMVVDEIFDGFEFTITLLKGIVDLIRSIPGFLFSVGFESCAHIIAWWIKNNSENIDYYIDLMHLEEDREPRKIIIRAFSLLGDSSPNVKNKIFYYSSLQYPSSLSDEVISKYLKAVGISSDELQKENLNIRKKHATQWIAKNCTNVTDYDNLLGIETGKKHSKYDKERLNKFLLAEDDRLKNNILDMVAIHNICVDNTIRDYMELCNISDGDIAYRRRQHYIDNLTKCNIQVVLDDLNRHTLEVVHVFEEFGHDGARDSLINIYNHLSYREISDVNRYLKLCGISQDKIDQLQKKRDQYIERMNREAEERERERERKEYEEYLKNYDGYRDDDRFESDQERRDYYDSFT